MRVCMFLRLPVFANLVPLAEVGKHGLQGDVGSKCPIQQLSMAFPMRQTHSLMASN